MGIDPASDIAHRVSGQPLGDPGVLSLWVSVAADGSVTSGEGVPEWWAADIQHC